MTARNAQFQLKTAIDKKNSSFRFSRIFGQFSEIIIIYNTKHKIYSIITLPVGLKHKTRLKCKGYSLICASKDISRFHMFYDTIHA